jgi:Ala-tRNA(Pro) deacylase
MLDKPGVYKLLEERGIAYQNFDHVPIFTVEEGDRLHVHHGEGDTRSLFLRDRKHRDFYLLTLPCHKELDLTVLRTRISSRRLGLADPEELQHFLGVQHGWVNPLSILNDSEKKVTMVFDASLQGQRIGYHPMANDATIFVSFEATYQLIAEHGNPIILCEI